MPRVDDQSVASDRPAQDGIIATLLPGVRYPCLPGARLHIMAHEECMATIRSSILAAAGLLLGFAASVAVAQTAPAKPGAKPAGKTLGGKTAGGKQMTREELRGCLKQLDDVNRGNKAIEVLRPVLDRERDGLKAEGEVLKAEFAEVERKLAAVREWEGRVRAHAVAIESFNQRSAALSDAPANQRDKLTEELKADREGLQKSREALAADEAMLVPAYQTSARSFNERAKVRDAKVVEWNQRNAAAVEASMKAQEARASWLNECANRPYLEDDEIAIKAGK